jgi:hypothetical protein
MQNLPAPPDGRGPSKPRRILIPVVIAAVAFAVGAVAGASAGEDESSSAAPSPSPPTGLFTRTETETVTTGPTVTVTTGPTVTETITKTATRTVTAEPKAARSFGDGTWRVGAEVAPGTYRAPGGGSCYWARLRNFTGGLNSIIANGGFSKNQTVTIQSSDTGFETRDCGTWERI